MSAQYTFETTRTYAFDSKPARRRVAVEDDPTEDGNGSLTYSAASSIHSVGESTDSSLADALRGLDVHDSKEIALYLESRRRDEKSVAGESLAYSTVAGESVAYSTGAGESLAYSTDAESQMRSLATDAESRLHGTDYLNSIAG
jgi:hypothetical protein